MKRPLTIKSYGPGVLGKTLDVRDLDDGPQGNDEGKVRLTIEDNAGDRSSIVVLAGDVRAALGLKSPPKN